ISGVGEIVDPQVALSEFAIAVALPKFGLSTPDVYRRWDELEGPTGEAIDDAALPPVLRDRLPIRNDLLPAALDIVSELGDFMADLRAAWDTAVCLTGSGSACFGYFASVDEAEDAVVAVASLIATGRGVGLRDHGVRVVR
ncbi:MAG: hypothetical protein WBM90_11405, partial [Acidimicrobiia bacterium]